MIAAAVRVDTINNFMLSVALTQMNASFLHSDTGRGSLRENSLYITAAHHEVYGLFWVTRSWTLEIVFFFMLGKSNYYH